MIILNLLLLVTIFVFIGWACFYLWEGRKFQSGDRVVYMGSNLKEQGEALVDIINRYITGHGKATADYTLIEPGAGMAYVATFLSRKFTWKKVEAVELRRSVLWLGKLRLWILRNHVVHYRFADIFNFQPAKPAVQYCYLTTGILTKMYEMGKFDNSLVVCLTFEISGCKPVEIISLPSWQGAIRVYDFRKKESLPG